MPQSKTSTLQRRRPPEPRRLPAEFRIIEAHAPGDFRFLEAAGDDEQNTGDTRQLRRFTMTAYTGGKLLLAGFAYPVVVDLSGLKISAKSRPILRDHDAARIVGHTENIEVNAGLLKLAGVISGANDHAREVIDSGDNGFPWQSSIGAVAQRIVFVDRGEQVEVNGRRFSGPLYVARQSALREVSFVALGADDQTVARLVARHQQQSSQQVEVYPMEFETWVSEQGFDPDTLDEKQTTSLRAMFESSVQSPASSETIEPTTALETGSTRGTIQSQHSGHSTLDAGRPPTPQAPLSPVDQLRAEWAAERRRIAKIAEICGGNHADIEAQAIEEGWDSNRTELAVLRASRPKAPPIHGTPPVASARVLEAAVWMSAKISEQE